MVRAPDCRSGGRGFEPRPSRHLLCEFTLLSCCCDRAAPYAARFFFVWKFGGLEAWRVGGAPEVEARATAMGGDETGRALARPGERSVQARRAKPSTATENGERNAPAVRRMGPPYKDKSDSVQRNGNRKDARVGANRFGLHRSLCDFAADRARRPPLRALWPFIKKRRKVGVWGGAPPD